MVYMKQEVANNLCIRKLVRTASLVEEGQDAIGAYGTFGSLSPASFEDRCQTHGW